MQSNNRALNHTEVKTQDMLKPSLVKPRNHVHNLTGHQNPASLTPENIVLYIKRKYYESLYVTKPQLHTLPSLRYHELEQSVRLT